MWKIKDPELKRKMNQFISDDGINEVCRNEMADSSTYIFFSFEDDAYNFRIDKSYFEEVPRNMLDVWKPFPEKRPPGYGAYLVTRQMKTDTGTTISFLDFARFEYGQWMFKNDVVAFCNLPEPYFPMEKKHEVPISIQR